MREYNLPHDFRAPTVAHRKPGRPPGSGRKAQLYQDLAHGIWRDLEPLSLPGRRLEMDWLRSFYARPQLIAMLRKRWPARYASLSDKTLNRYIGALLPAVYPLYP